MLGPSLTAMAGTRRRLKKDLIAQADPEDQRALLSQRALVTARELGREEPVRRALPVGTLDDGTLARVDPAGMVQPEGSPWVLDWWVGAEDQWHFASSDQTVGQSLVGSSPLVQTSMHVPGGEVIQRVFGARASIKSGAEPWSGGVTVVEFENQCGIPVVLAVVIRPLTLWGDGSINTLASEGASISVDGRTAAVLSRPVLRRVVGPPGTTAIRVDLEDDEHPDGVWSVEGQLAEGAFIVPLPYTTVVRVMLPSGSSDEVVAVADEAEAERTRWATAVVWDAPTAEQVEKGWDSITQNMTEVSSPDSLIDELVTVSGRFLTFMGTDSFFDTVADHSSAFRAAVLSEALVTSGAVQGLDPIARALAGAETVTRGIRMDDRSDASVALLHCAAPLLVGSRSDYWSDLLLGPVAKAIHRISRDKAIGGRETLGDPATERVLRASAAVGASRLVPALTHVGQPDVAEAAHALYHRLSGGHVHEHHHHDHDGHSHADRVTSTAPGSGRTTRSGNDGSSSGGGPTLRRAVGVADHLAEGHGIAHNDLVTLCDLGNLGVLPAEVDGAGLPVGDVAVDAAATALRLSAVMSAFVRDTPPSIEILAGWADVWFDKPVEVNRVATRLGSVSFALRWSGGRPILLWEIEPAIGVDPMLHDPIITAPTLDPSWHAHGWSGEAMLGAVEISEETRRIIAERDQPRRSVTLGVRKRESD